MSNSLPHSHACPACGTFVSTGGGRCPSCGAQLPDVMGSVPQAVHRGVMARPKPPGRGPVLPILMVGGAVTIVGVFLLWWSLGGGASGAASASVAPPPPPPPVDSASQAPTKIELGTALADARRRATGWYRDASLISIEASPVTAGKLEGDGASAMITWGKPTGRLGPGAPVGAERLIVTAKLSGAVQREERGGNKARGVAEPSCTLDAAWRAAIASGLPSSKPLTMSYAHSDKYDRAVWTAKAADGEGPERALDGTSCAIMVR